MPREVFDIFLSSTSADLQPYRAKVTAMIARMRQTTIRMETFGAKATKPLKTCSEEVQQCDALIVIVGHRYGWVPSKKEGGDGIKSITWWEVQWALDANKPVYAFLVDPEAAWPGAREQDELVSATTDGKFVEIGRAVRHLNQFRSFLEAETTRELFSSADDLAAKVATSLHVWLLEQAVAAVRASYPTGQRLPPLPGPAGGIGSPARIDYLYWQEQIHILCAQHLVEGTAGSRVALIAGRANPDHPALAAANIKQFDVRRKPRESPPDDYTTALAALLVANGSAGPYRGVAPQAHLLVLHVLDDQATSSTADMLVALDLAIRERANVICLTLGSLAHSEAERIAYERAAELGVVVVCPSGNDGDDKPIYPGAYPGCVSAGAVDSHNRLAYFSSFGDWVTTVAPGVDLPVAVGKDGYRKWSGSSFACAILAGIVSLMVQVNPNLTPGQLKEILSTTGLPLLRDATNQAAGDVKVVDACEAVLKAIDFAN